MYFQFIYFLSTEYICTHNLVIYLAINRLRALSYTYRARANALFALFLWTYHRRECETHYLYGIRVCISINEFYLEYKALEHFIVLIHQTIHRGQHLACVYDTYISILNCVLNETNLK